MKIVRTTDALRKILTKTRAAGKSIGLVPTMGCLHKGHLSLVRSAKKQTDLVVVSIFVNPIQFGPKEDLKKYPRDLKRDLDLLKKQGIDLVFVPSVAEIYPKGFSSYFEVPSLSNKLCGKSRPGHFRGVATVVARLFDIVRPHKAFFGKKDFQQQVIIKKMAQDLGMEVEIISLPTVRENDGLAMSSRNKYLSAKERKLAPILYQSLQAAKKLAVSHKTIKAANVIEMIRENIARFKEFRIDYIAIVDPDTLEDIKVIKKGRPVLIALAVHLGRARLIDNIET